MAVFHDSFFLLSHSQPMARVLDSKTGICCVLVLLFHLGHSAAVSAGSDADREEHDLQKRSSDWQNEAAPESKRNYHNFRFDFGKRFGGRGLGYDLKDGSKRSDSVEGGDEEQVKRGWSLNRYDLGKRFGYKQDSDAGHSDGLSQLDSDPMVNQAEPAVKRGLGSYRFDFGKRYNRQFKYADFDLGKRAVAKRYYNMLRGTDLAKRFRYAMSHQIGKIEIIGLVENQVIFKIHDAKYTEQTGNVFMRPVDEVGGWLPDDLELGTGLHIA